MDTVKPRKRTTLFSIAAMLWLLVPATAYAQFETATVLGTMRDSGGAVLPGVTVKLKNIATGIEATAQTDEDGNYQFLNVKIGAYKVSAELQGFSTAVAESVSVAVNARQRLDLTMKPGAVTETVTITDAAQLLETESSVRGQVINRQQMSTCRSTGALTPISPCSCRACANRT